MFKNKAFPKTKNNLNLTNKNLLNLQRISKNPFNKESLTEDILLIIVCHMNHRIKITKTHVNLLTLLKTNNQIIIKANNLSLIKINNQSLISNLRFLKALLIIK